MILTAATSSSDGGLLLLRQAERKLGICGRLADAMPDRRDARSIRHEMFELVMARVSAIACGHKDAIDLDRLRHDPLMKIAVGRCPITGAPLASQSTISRLENAPSKTEAARLAAFPSGRHDDQVDSISQALGHKIASFWTKESLDGYNNFVNALWQDAIFARLSGRPW